MLKTSSLSVTTTNVQEASAGGRNEALSLQRHLYKTQTKIVRYKMCQLLKPPVTLKTLRLQCVEPFGGHPLTYKKKFKKIVPAPWTVVIS